MQLRVLDHATSSNLLVTSHPRGRERPTFEALRKVQRVGRTEMRRSESKRLSPSMGLLISLDGFDRLISKQISYIVSIGTSLSHNTYTLLRRRSPADRTNNRHTYL